MFLYVRALLLILGISFAAQDDNENMVLQRVSSLVLWYFLEVFSFLSYGFQNLQKPSGESLKTGKKSQELYFEVFRLSFDRDLWYTKTEDKEKVRIK